MSFVSTLRRATAADHDMVDSLFGGFSLDRASDYRRFLVAHARALPAVESALVDMTDAAWPAWRSRISSLAADLSGLGEAMPQPLPFALAGEGEGWGALYVIEGSRLGGQILARTVPTELPSAYLESQHQSGEWRRLLMALDAQAEQADEAWRQAALTGAKKTFALYRLAAANDATES